MNRNRTNIIVLCLALTTFSATAFAQEGRLDPNSPVQRVWGVDTTAKLSQSARIDGGVAMREQFGFHWETRIVPATPALGEGFRTFTSNDAGVLHRVMLDHSGRTYFGYDVLVDVLTDANTFKVTFRPLQMNSTLAQELSMDRWAEWKPLAAPRFPAPQNVRSGEILELTLLTKAWTNQRIIDYISIQEPLRKVSPFQNLPEARQFSFPTGTPRDITLNDVELRILAPRLTVNGKLDASTTSHFEAVAGPLVWFYVQNRGRFILSLQPRPGFIKAGEVRGTTLTFKDGPDSYSLSAGARIAPGQAAYNLYLRRQPEWKPTYPFADLSAFNMGAEERIEPLLGN